MTDITVQYERKLSDGQFGSEGLSVSVTESFAADPGDDVLDVVFQRVRTFVLVELSKSEAERVRIFAQRELNPPRPTPSPTAVGAPATDLEDLPF